MSKLSLKRISFIPIILLVILSISGCSTPIQLPPISETHSETNPSECSPQQMLLISTELAAEHFETHPASELNGEFSLGIYYNRLNNVTIDIDGNPMKLEEAVTDGFISKEEILFYVQTDAKNGFCEVSAESYHGLTSFSYQYPEYELTIIHDILETPARGQQLVDFLMVSEPGKALSPYAFLVDWDTGERLDDEDWGISFELTDISPTGATVTCTQSGGQQIGELEMYWYLLANEEGFLPELNSDGSGESHTMEQYTENLQIKPNDSTEFTFEWETVYGELPSGTYELLLHVQDVYDKAQVHPLMQNFQDRLVYTVDFIIP